MQSLAQLPIWNPTQQPIIVKCQVHQINRSGDLTMDQKLRRWKACCSLFSLEREKHFRICKQKRLSLAKHLGIPLYCHLTIASAASTSASASRLPFQQHLRRESRECSQASHLMVNGRISWSDQRNLLSGDAFDEQIHNCTDSDVKHCQISDLLYISS